MSNVFIPLGLVVLVVGVIALIRGRMRWLAISSRKVAAGVLVGGFALVIAGSATAPQSSPKLAGASGPPVTTTVAPPPTTVPVTTAPPVTTTTVAPPPPPVTTTTPPPVPEAPPITTEPEIPAAQPDLPCDASVSNPSPHHNQTVDVEVSTTSGASVDVVAQYKSKGTEHTTTARNGHAAVPFDISTATYGFDVTVNVTVTKGDASNTCQTDFTPEP